MRLSIQSFLNRPIAEDFSFRNQSWQSIQGGIYVFLFVYLFSGARFPEGSRIRMLALFGLGCTLATLFANWVVPALLPRLYNEDRWTVWKYTLQLLFVLFCISVSNQLVLVFTNNDYPPFWQMYATVTLIGFFPIVVGVFVAEQRRLKRNLETAQRLNQELAGRVEPPQPLAVIAIPAEVDQGPAAARPQRLVLASDTGKERLSLQPDQLLYLESVGNYVDVHWLNLNQPQKTVLRSTLKDMEEELSPYAQFFRCHRAFLVNLNAVRQTEGNARGYQLILAGATARIPVSRRYIDAFDSRIRQVNQASCSSQ